MRTASVGGGALLITGPRLPPASALSVAVRGTSLGGPTLFSISPLKQWRVHSVYSTCSAVLMVETGFPRSMVCDARRARGSFCVPQCGMRPKPGRCGCDAPPWGAFVQSNYACAHAVNPSEFSFLQSNGNQDIVRSAYPQAARCVRAAVAEFNPVASPASIAGYSIGPSSRGRLGANFSAAHSSNPLAREQARRHVPMRGQRERPPFDAPSIHSNITRRTDRHRSTVRRQLSIWRA
ncbi:hypothetical protein BamIOP4010DRAFT_1321 [Burkholderia ambifaria IOP40-10]|uniref:Uncharacterized protein n=1 Tax=Burkholderia ambifaria IOP40-10 TaxID=396596 RepID=B1FBB2_9BURK|nr:hypothetical protein BamIOP4010DRAFT_1321 [Burkholderia ambifaria IOP40-10]